MTDTQQLDADWTAPLRELIASLREMEATFKQERGSSCSIVPMSRSAICPRWMPSRP
jgi:hypothetical protein